ncbi:MAG TPA: hypothetical protein VHQ86_00265 [Candidatus Saccharimonadia bacterium]|jgi:hypothetical protein|nr:hypothetical protein [Candidatus Saccharimonadia bacterium]
MDELKNKHNQKLLDRAEAQKRPPGVDRASPPAETLADRLAFERPDRPEHTSEKEHPPAKE